MTFYFNCPYCNGNIQIEKNELNCRIFRHAIFRHDGNQLNPHAPQKECERVVEQNLVYGCAKPFKIINIDGKETIIKCEYI